MNYCIVKELIKLLRGRMLDKDTKTSIDSSSSQEFHNNTVQSVKSFCSSDSQIVNALAIPLDKMPTGISDDYHFKGNQSDDLENMGADIPNLDTNEKTEDENESQEPLTSDLIETLPYSKFSKTQQVVIFGIVIYIGFLGPMSGNIYIPALPTLQTAFGVDPTVINATVSVFMAVFAVGPLFWGLFADVCGRKWLYLCSLVLVTIVNLLLATVPTNIGALYVLRVFQALGSSSVISLGTGTVTDIIPPKHRGKAIAYFMLGPNMGPIVGPIVAGLILFKGDHWRWLFGFTCIASAIAFLLVLAFLPETLRCIVGNGDKKWVKNNKHDESNESMSAKDIGVMEKSIPDAKVENDKNKWKFFSDIGIQKPVTDDPIFQKLYPKPMKPGLIVYWSMVKFPPIIITSMTTALLFANYYAFSVTFSHFLQNDYNFSQFETGLAYICPGVAMLIGSQTGGHLSDILRSRWIKNHPESNFPIELRLVLQIWGIAVNTAGCIGYGWAIHYHYSIVLVFAFAAMNAFGLTWCSNTTMTYLTEILARRAASTVALSSFFRNTAAAISSAVIMTLCSEMGVGWCFTGLGLCNVISLTGILFLLQFGGKWRHINA